MRPQMQLGIFAKTFARPDAASCLQAVAQAGIPATQFNLSVAGLPTIPEGPVRAEVIDEISAAAERTGVALAAISGTFNAAHPDPSHRQTYLDRFPYLCAAARDLGIDDHHPQQRIPRRRRHVAGPSRQHHGRGVGRLPHDPAGPGQARRGPRPDPRRRTRTQQRRRHG